MTKMPVSDIELLRYYASNDSEISFSELVRRHIGLVYSTALRQLSGDESMARDVAQTVFSDLARKACLLTDRTSLAGWLYTSTHYAAAKAVRSEERRRVREREAFAMQQLSNCDSNSDWEQIRPVLDRAMHELSVAEREALVLRFFEQQDLQAIGLAMGISADAARKRVDRSLERLRARLAKHGVTSSTSALCLVMSGPALAAAPPGLVPAITAVALNAATSGSFSTLTLIKFMASSKLKIGIAALVVVSVAMVPIVIQQRALSQSRGERDQAHEEIDGLRGQLDELTKKYGRLLDEHQHQQSELATLRRLKAEMQAIKPQIKEYQMKLSTSSVSSEKPATGPNETDSQKFKQLIGYVAKLRNRYFGGGAQPTAEEKKWMEEAKPYFKELLKSPELFAQLHSSLVQGVLNLQDESKLNSIRSVIQNSATEAANQGVLYSEDPSKESDDWKRQRHELDRQATRAVQELLTEPELSLFDRRFLGALVMDLTPGRWDPSFEFIDPILRGVAPDQLENAALERSPATGALVPVVPQP
ncbi:MAG: sigma-70 family RNA polymerase sigma factor [Verrucomicrobiota bacterium]